MQMNRQWMYGDRRTTEYITGLHNFIGVAKANRLNGFMCCPCVVCQNKKDYSDYKTLHAHLLRSGFMPSYNCLTKHGEREVIMEDNEEEEDDDNYHNMFSEYGDTATGKMKIKRHQMMILVGPLLMQRKTVKLKRRRRSWSRC